MRLTYALHVVSTWPHWCMVTQTLLNVEKKIMLFECLCREMSC